MDQTQETKEVVTVAEMARMCHLSRSRFYMLVKDGIMPSPCRNEATKRPYYNRQQQEQCLLVRRTNCGINGKPILFYASRLLNEPMKQRKVRSNNKVHGNTCVDPLIEEIQHGLEQLGMIDIADDKIRQALADVYPDGHMNIPIATLLMDVFRRLKNGGGKDG